MRKLATRTPRALYGLGAEARRIQVSGPGRLGVPFPVVPNIDDNETSGEQHELHELVRLLARADAWSRYTGSDPNVWAVQRGTVLADDNTRTDPYQLSHRANRAITVAVDHLHGLRLMIMGPPDHEMTSLYLRTHAPFTLLRATMENAATAIWLLSPADSDERALRAFRLGAAEVRNSEAARALTGTVGPRTRDQRLDLIRERARAAGLDPASALSRTDYAEIMRDAGGRVGVGGDAAEALWRACSALAHGDLWPVVSILSTTDAQVSARVTTKAVTTNTKILVKAAAMSVAMIDTAFRLYGEQRSRP